MNEANPEQLISALPEIPVADDAPPVECDICGEPIAVGEDDGAFVGKGVFLSVRGDEVRYEDAPLCSTCATAIGINALIRAEIEEDEG